MKKFIQVLAITVVVLFVTNIKAQSRLNSLNSEIINILPAEFNTAHTPLIYIMPQVDNFGEINNAFYLYDLDFNFLRTEEKPNRVMTQSDCENLIFNEQTNTWETESGSEVVADRSFYSIVGMNYYNIDETGIDCNPKSSLTLTQTLFNDDETFEFIMPGLPVTLRDTTFEGNTAFSCSYVRFSGYDIKNATGDIIATLTCDANYCVLEREDIALYKMNGNYYIVFTEKVMDNVVEEFEYKTVVYKIERDNNTQSISRVDVDMPLFIRPTLADRSEQIIIDFGENTDAKEVSIVSANGQILKRILVRQGEKQITIPANELNRGTNIISARSQNKKGAKKVIVK
ncbi:MAG: hypothetical protein IJ213_06520 [Bacteroidales bacterium]|nr:hypothetical protein [Bacteroidales bacterium]